MRLLVRLVFIISATALGTAKLYSQSYPVFTNYNAKQGLPQSSIYGITQDQNGFIWVGTAGGLARFDGYRFSTYKMNAQDSTAISSYKEFRFYHDSKGRLWIVHFNGISIYDERTDKFKNIFVYSPKNVVIAENHFFGEDADFIWVGLCSYGVVKVNKRTLSVQSTPLTFSSHKPSTMVHYQGFLEKGLLWIVDNNENNKNTFSVFHTGTGKVDTFSIPINNLSNLNDSEMVGIDNKHVFIIKKASMSFRKLSVYPDGKEHNAVNIYRKSAHEVILSSATKGLFFIDSRGPAVTNRITVTDPSNPQSYLYARSVFEDRSGNLWVGTRGDGLEKIRFPYKKFRSYQVPNARNNVFGIYADDSDIYAGVHLQGLTRFPKDGGEPEAITINRHFPQVLNNAFNIKPYGHERLIIIATSSENNGVNMPFFYTKSTGRLTPLNAAVQQIFRKYWGRGNMRHFVYRERSGSYLTNIGEYLAALTPCQTNDLCPVIINRFPGENLTCGFTDSKGVRWVGSFTGAFVSNGSKWQRVPLKMNKEIKTIAEDADGNIWMGTNDEIYVLNRNLATIHHFTEEKELANGHIYTIISDNDGNMWFSHNKGLSVYYRKGKKFAHFDSGDGIPSSEYNIGSSYKKPDGELFFGGINGVTAFYPGDIRQNPHSPLPLVTGIKVFDQPIDTDIPAWNIRHLSLPYTENSISFEFALPEYTNEKENVFQYKMDGVDNRWIQAGDAKSTRYGGLSPGKYRFQLRGANSDGVFGAITMLTIEIVPPYWQRTWFVVMLVVVFLLAAIAAGIGIQKIRQRKAIRTLELQHKIQLERERISRDLHDNVGTQLSLISKNLENVIQPSLSVSEDDRMQNLQSISQTSKEVIFTLRETIWALNREEISVEELSDKLKAFTQKILVDRRNCHLAFHEALETEVMLGPSEAIHLFRICQEAVVNSLKYAEASEMEIRISTCPAQKYTVVIADNGIGFDTGTATDGGSYGLDNMQFRSREIGCTFHINTSPGKGTAITITKK